MNADGSGRTVLTRDEHENRAPVFTPDGRSIVYVSVTAHGTELCRMNADGSQRRVLAKTFPNASPDVSPDGRWVAFEHPEVSTQLALQLARVPIDGGAVEILSGRGATMPAYSPDGSKIAAYTYEGEESIVIFPSARGELLQAIRFAYAYIGSQLAWTPDGTAVITNTAPSDRANLWVLPLDGSKPYKLTSFDERQLMAYAPLPGGRGWVLSRGDLTRDAVMITGFE